MAVDPRTKASGLTASELKSGGIESGFVLLANVDCKLHDMQQVSRPVPSGPPELFPAFDSTLQGGLAGNGLSLMMMSDGHQTCVTNQTEQ